MNGLRDFLKQMAAGLLFKAQKSVWSQLWEATASHLHKVLQRKCLQRERVVPLCKFLKGSLKRKLNFVDDPQPCTPLHLRKGGGGRPWQQSQLLRVVSSKPPTLGFPWSNRYRAAFGVTHFPRTYRGFQRTLGLGWERGLNFRHNSVKGAPMNTAPTKDFRAGAPANSPSAHALGRGWGCWAGLRLLGDVSRPRQPRRAGGPATGRTPSSHDPHSIWAANGRASSAVFARVTRCRQLRRPITALRRRGGAHASQ